MPSISFWVRAGGARRPLLARCRTVAASLLVWPLLSASFAHAQGNECAPLGRAAALRNQGKLRAAHAELSSCVEESECNAEARRRCAAEQQALAHQMPSVVVHAHDGRGNDLVDVSVALDGEPFVSKLDGLAQSIDAGEHTFVFTRAGLDPVAHTELIEPTDKFKLITVELPDAELLRERAAAEAPTASQPPSSPARLIAGASLAAVGVIGVAAFAGLGLDARAEERDLRARNCKPDCPEGVVDSVSVRYTLSNVSLGVGLAAFGAAAWVLLTGPSSKAPDPNAKVDVVAGPHGGTLTLTSQF
jgi:hypothetical protein